MAEQTNDLKLFKYNTATDGKEVFSIEKSMNENWDKIDAFSSAIKSLSNLDAVGEKRFTDINTELSKKLEAEVLLAENGYIKFNNGFQIVIYYANFTQNVPANNYLTFNITFPLAFTTNHYAFVTQQKYNTLIAVPYSHTTTQCIIRVHNKDNKETGSTGNSLFALIVGY